MEGQSAGNNGSGILGRTFWIQGRSGPYWQNLESHQDGQSAIGRLGLLVGDDRYDELRLIQADLSPITGKTSYVHIVTVRDGHVLEPASAERSPATAPHAVASEPEPAPEPQMHFWPEPHPEELQPKLNLYAPEDAEYQNPHPSQYEPPSHGGAHARADGYDADIRRAASYQDMGAGRQTRETPRSGSFHARPGEQTVGGWRIPDEEGADFGPDYGQTADPGQTHNPSRDERQREDGRALAKKRRTQRRGLSLDPNDRQDGRGRISGSPDHGRRVRRKEPSLFRRGMTRLRENVAGPRSEQAEGRGGRTALLSGVFAGALAAGLALASLSPETAARFYGGLIGDLGGIVQSSDLVGAIESGDIRQVRARLLEGADPNSVDREGTPVLLRAARAGNLAALTLLLQAGADPTLPLQDGRSAMHYLAAEGRGQALARVLASGAPVDLAGGSYGCLTPLSIAAANGRVRAAGLLAEQGASLRPQKSCDVGPMEIAASHPHVLARLEQIRADRESLLKIAAGPAVPNTDRRNAPSATILTPEKAEIAADAADVTGPFAPPPRATVPQSPKIQLPSPVSESAEMKSPAPPRRSAAPKTINVESLSVKAAPAEPVAPAPTGIAATDRTTSGDAITPRTEKGAEVLAALTGPDGTPRARSKPAPPQLTPKQFVTRMRAAIDGGDQATARVLIREMPPGLDINRLRIVVRDRFGAGERRLTDHAALSGQQEIAALLSNAGGKITPSALHLAIKHAGTPGLGELPARMIALGADINAMQDGLTPLMRAALRGDVATADMLLKNGANAALIAGDGRTAAEMAGASGRTALQERLVLQARAADYQALMLGMSWSDTLATLKPKTEACKSIGDDFTACKMKSPAWIEDAAVVVAQFDGRNGNRLVAIQIDSQPLTTPGMAKDRFAAVVREIEQRLPTDHVGFSTANAPDGNGFFRALRPEVNAGSYFAYWPDQDKSRPVFVHLKLSGINDKAGFYRIIIGNPFRTG